MNKTLIPTSDADFANFAFNLGAKLAPMVTTLGLTAADATAVSADATGMQAAVMDQLAKMTAAKSSTQAKAVLRQAAERRMRALIGRVKAHPAYTPALGEQLGIVAPEDSSATRPMLLATQNSRPTLAAVLGADGKVGVKFTKNGFSGVMMYGRRGGESEFLALGKQLRSPFVDERANLAAGQPETREYRAVYLDGDQPAGTPSAAIIVTVPAQMLASAAAESIPLAKAA